MGKSINWSRAHRRRRYGNFLKTTQVARKDPAEAPKRSLRLQAEALSRGVSAAAAQFYAWREARRAGS